MEQNNSVSYFYFYFVPGSKLIKLHKRATSRFGTYIHQNVPNYEKDLVTIWLQYAKIQYKYNESSSSSIQKRKQDALSTFKLLQNKNLGQSMAEYYIARADFEYETIHENLSPNSYGCSTMDAITNAIEIVEGGIKKDAKPVELLNTYLDKLHKQKIKMTTMMNINGGEKSNKRDSNDVVRDPTKAMLPSIIPPTRKSAENSSSGTVTDSSKETQKMNKTQLTALSSSSVVSNYISRPKKRSATSLRTKIKRKNNNSNTPGGLGGKMGGPPKRISSIDDDDDEGDDRDSDIDQSKSDDSLEGVVNKRLKVHDHVRQSEKITKADIGYLLNWNPGRFQQSKNQGVDGHCEKKVDPSPTSLHQTTRKVFQPSMDKIDETTKEHQSTGTNSQTTNSTGNQNTSSMGSQNTSSTGSQNTNSIGGRDFTNTVTNQQTSETSFMSKADGLRKQGENKTVDESLSEIPRQIVSERQISAVSEFLPLISEKKMIKVNGVKYVKLSVIGKGGSCKVYRTLTKDGQNVAIKKVNLAGIQKKAIIGYANEIKLLKRLSGNPAIIQLYDSEVSLEKKAIYLVMEIGEIDLNHVVSRCCDICYVDFSQVI